MNSVLRRSLLRPPSNPAVLRRQLLTSNISYRVPRSRRQYSTHNTDAFKDKSAVGVRTPFLPALSPPLHAPCQPSLPSHDAHSHFLKPRCLPLRPRPFSCSPALASTFTLGGKSNDCKSKNVSPTFFFGASLCFGVKTRNREGDGITLHWTCSRWWAV
jgi:hypothetical protein